MASAPVSSKVISTILICSIFQYSCKSTRTDSDTSSIRPALQIKCDPKKPASFFNCNPSAAGGGIFNGQRIPGQFGTAQGEIEKGNLKAANISCLSDAVNSGKAYPGASTEDIYSFAATYGNTQMAMPTPIENRIFSHLKSSSTSTPKAFRVAECDQDVRRTACMQLFEKSLVEVPQAYHKSELATDSRIWREVTDYLGLTIPGPDRLSKDLTLLLAEEAAKLDQTKDKEKFEILSRAISEDSLLVASRLVIAKLDMALANKDRKSADKAKAMLKKVNPSAAHSVDCILGYLPQEDLYEDGDKLAPNAPGGAPKEKIGPLSGTNYSTDQHQTGEPASIAILTILVTVGIAVVHTMIDNAQHQQNRHDEANRRAEDRRLQDEKDAKDDLARNIRDYGDCKFGADICAGLYPKGKAEVDKIRKASEAEKAKAGTGGPTRRVETDPATPAAPTPNKTPCKGCGGAGGELVVPDIDMGKLRTARQASSLERRTNFDPSAAERLCNSVLRDFQSFMTNKVSGPSRPFLDNMIVESDISVAPVFQVTDFDKWTPEFWKDQKIKDRLDLSNVAKHCQAINR